METIVKILRTSDSTATRKLANAELHFISGDLDGLKLIGFAVRRSRDGKGRDVTFPSREFTVDGRRRRFSLLRSILDPNAQTRLRDLVRKAYEREL